MKCDVKDHLFLDAVFGTDGTPFLKQRGVKFSDMGEALFCSNKCDKRWQETDTGRCLGERRSKAGSLRVRSRLEGTTLDPEGRPETG